MSEALMRSYYAAYNAEDADALAALVDPDVTLVSAMGTQQGRDAYLATYRYMIATFVDRMEPTAIDATTEGAKVRIVDTLTARGDVADFMGASLKAGETMRLDLRGHYTIRDGRITQIEIAPA